CSSRLPGRPRVGTDCGAALRRSTLMIFVVVPTYNERDNLPRLLEALLRIDLLNVLVVDDGSPDGTGDDADRIAAGSGGRVHVLHRRGQRGLGRSYIDGFQHVLRLGATRVCQM